MPDDFELLSDKQGRLNLKRSGQPDVPDVRIRRSFPWSHPDQHISVRSAEGKELLLIVDLSSVAAAEREIIRQALRQTVFIPRITRVDHVDVRFGYQQWQVQTDRGPSEFRVQEREDIRFLNDGRFNVKDVDGNLYELPRLDELDEHSRKAVQSLI